MHTTSGCSRCFRLVVTGARIQAPNEVPVPERGRHQMIRRRRKEIGYGWWLGMPSAETTFGKQG